MKQNEKENFVNYEDKHETADHNENVDIQDQKKAANVEGTGCGCYQCTS